MRACPWGRCWDLRVSTNVDRLPELPACSTSPPQAVPWDMAYHVAVHREIGKLPPTPGAPGAAGSPPGVKPSRSAVGAARHTQPAALLQRRTRTMSPKADEAPGELGTGENRTGGRGVPSICRGHIRRDGRGSPLSGQMQPSCWLARDHAVSVVPSVQVPPGQTPLLALRGAAAPASRARAPRSQKHPGVPPPPPPADQPAGQPSSAPRPRVTSRRSRPRALPRSRRRPRDPGASGERSPPREHQRERRVRVPPLPPARRARPQAGEPTATAWRRSQSSSGGLWHRRCTMRSQSTSLIRWVSLIRWGRAGEELAGWLNRG
jgi:hypothetical protein